MEDGWEGGRTGRRSARGVRGSGGHEPLTPSRFLPRPASFRPVLRCRAHHPPPARHAVRCKRVTGEGRWLTVARRSEAQGPPLPARRGPAGVGAGLHLHEGDGELVAFPVVPVDPLRGERDKHVSPAKRGISPLAANSVAQAPRRSKGLCFLNTPVPGSLSGTCCWSPRVSSFVFLASTICTRQSRELTFKILTVREHLGENSCVCSHLVEEPGSARAWWLAISVCTRLRGFLGCWTCSANTAKVPAGLAGHPAQPLDMRSLRGKRVRFTRGHVSFPRTRLRTQPSLGNCP